MFASTVEYFMRHNQSYLPNPIILPLRKYVELSGGMLKFLVKLMTAPPDLDLRRQSGALQFWS
jgi:hypothetical protein